MTPTTATTTMTPTTETTTMTPTTATTTTTMTPTTVTPAMTMTTTTDTTLTTTTMTTMTPTTATTMTTMSTTMTTTMTPTTVNVLTYSYTYTADPLGCCADANNNRYYDDPANSILNDGVTDDMITISNSVNRLDQSMPILDFGMLKTVHFVDVSYIVAWGKPALQSLKFSGANSADSFTEDLTTTDGFVSGDGGNTTTFTGFRSWGCIRYLRIDDQLPKISVLSEIRVSGTDCEAATAAPAKLPLP